jgi:excisionase family DNA binding protein
MVALRSVPGPGDDAARDGRAAQPNPADWLTLQQAACELGISASTARRMIRDGRLRNRIVPRPGGFAYLIYLPNSRHAGGLHPDAHGDRPAPPGRKPVRLADYVRQHDAGTGDDAGDQIRRLEAQVERLSEALSRALRLKQKALPPGIGAAAADRTHPYERYRWLARRRRWWPF